MGIQLSTVLCWLRRMSQSPSYWKLVLIQLCLIFGCLHQFMKRPGLDFYRKWKEGSYSLLASAVGSYGITVVPFED